MMLLVKNRKKLPLMVGSVTIQPNDMVEITEADWREFASNPSSKEDVLAGRIQARNPNAVSKKRGR